MKSKDIVKELSNKAFSIVEQSANDPPVVVLVVMQSTEVEDGEEVQNLHSAYTFNKDTETEESALQVLRAVVDSREES